MVLDEINEPPQPLVFQVIWQLFVKAGGLGAIAGRVDKGVGMVESGLVIDPQRLLKVFLGLAGEAHDDVRREGDVGHGLAHACHQFEIALRVVRTPHPFEDPRRARLQRKVQLITNRWRLSHRSDHISAHVLRVRAHEANPIDSFDGVDCPQ